MINRYQNFLHTCTAIWTVYDTWEERRLMMAGIGLYESGTNPDVGEDALFLSRVAEAGEFIEDWETLMKEMQR